MSMKKLTDAQAKKILLKWPRRTRKLWPTPSEEGCWLRAQPPEGKKPGPRLRSPGAVLFRIQPDGMWVYLNQLNYVDVVCIEACGTIQNLSEKRSRYMPASHSLILAASKRWLNERIMVQHGGSQPRWKACGTIGAPPVKDLELPVRFLRVLFAIPNKIYGDWVENHTPAGWEYYCPHSALASYSSQKMQGFLRQLASTSHLYFQ